MAKYFEFKLLILCLWIASDVRVLSQSNQDFTTMDMFAECIKQQAVLHSQESSIDCTGNNFFPNIVPSLGKPFWQLYQAAYLFDMEPMYYTLARHYVNQIPPGQDKDKYLNPSYDLTTEAYQLLRKVCFLRTGDKSVMQYKNNCGQPIVLTISLKDIFYTNPLWILSGTCKLSGLCISSLDGFLPPIEYIDSIDLSDNYLTEIPESIASITTLKRLDLSHNNFKILPEFICNLPNLEVLVVNDNKLESLPANLGNLKKLWRIDAHNNCLTALPENIGLCGDLRILSLHHNQLQALPESFVALRNLEKIYFHDNNLCSDIYFPKYIFPHLRIVK